MSDSSKNTDPAANDSPDVVNEDVAGETGASDVEAPVSDADAFDGLDSATFEGEDTRIAELTVERDNFRDSLQRLQADFENFRKRMMKQQGETSERANEVFVAKLLPIIDTLDLAKAHEPSGPLEQISSALLEVLNKEGLERIVAVDQPFDPNHHEAVAHEPGEADAPTVSEEFRAGYLWKGRVLRPSMVKVVG